MSEGLDRQGNHLYPAFPYDHFARVAVVPMRLTLILCGRANRSLPPTAPNATRPCGRYPAWRFTDLPGWTDTLAVMASAKAAPLETGSSHEDHPRPALPDRRADCHDNCAGLMLRGDVIRPGQVNAFPGGRARQRPDDGNPRRAAKMSGDPGWIRTIDLPLRRRPLYPLSYGAPIGRNLAPSCVEIGGRATPRLAGKGGSGWRKRLGRSKVSVKYRVRHGDTRPVRAGVRPDRTAGPPHRPARSAPPTG